MKFSYEDLISGDSIFVPDTGHFRSPFLWELKPTKGIGMWTYNFYVNILSWNKEDFLKFFKTVANKNIIKLEENQKIEVYDIATLNEGIRMLLQDAMAFFLEERVLWKEKERKFEVLAKGDGEIIGAIDRKNFEDVRDMMLQLNYIDTESSKSKIKYASENAKKLLERAQKYTEENKKTAASDKSMSLGNIISKICASNIGYTLQNIYDLTIYQLYDQFFQLGYLRATNLNDMIFSNHGGDKFDMKAWLNPITKI